MQEILSATTRNNLGGVTLSSDSIAGWTDGPTSRPAFYVHPVVKFHEHIWSVPPDFPIQGGPLVPNILSEQDARAAISGLFSDSSCEASSMQLHNHFDDAAPPLPGADPTFFRR